MINLSKEVKIGLTATLILAVSLWGINFLKGKNILKPSQKYYVMFDQIDGLIESGAIYHRGYRVGNINGIVFDHKVSNKFILSITLEEPLKIPNNSIVKVKSSSLIASTNDLEILFSDENSYHSIGDTLISETNAGIADILEPMRKKLLGIMKGVDSLMISLNTVFNSDGIQSLQSTVTSLDETLKVLNTEFAPKGSLSETLENIASITSNLQSKNAEIAATIDNFSNISSQMDSVDFVSSLEKIDSTITELKGISQKLNNGTGTAGKLMNDTSLYTQLDSTAYHLSLLLKDMKENPKRYVHFSLFGNKEK